jgi:hypothetical protein
MTISFFCGMRMKRNIILFALMLGAFGVMAQKYESFRIEHNDVYWSYTYSFPGTADSLRREVVQMLKSKFYTFNVIRNEEGYNGELKHYRVDCRRFGRKYGNTPRMYWYGEWTGKFIVEVLDNYYRVTVYALYAENFQPAGNNNRGQRISTGRYIEAVTKRDRMTFKKSEYANLDLMSLSLKDEFDIRNTVIPNP